MNIETAQKIAKVYNLEVSRSGKNYTLYGDNNFNPVSYSKYQFKNLSHGDLVQDCKDMEFDADEDTGGDTGGDTCGNCGEDWDYCTCDEDW